MWPDKSFDPSKGFAYTITFQTQQPRVNAGIVDVEDVLLEAVLAGMTERGSFDVKAELDRIFK